MKSTSNPNSVFEPSLNPNINYKHRVNYSYSLNSNLNLSPNSLP